MIGSDTALAAVPSARRGRIYVASRSTGREGYGLWPSKGGSDLLGKKGNAEVCMNEKLMRSALIPRMTSGLHDRR